MIATADLIVTSALQKATLIAESLIMLHEANAIDERDDLTATTWMAWYDAILPDVRDIKILAGAMEIELAKRRGARIAQEGEQRGGDQKSEEIKLEQRTRLKSQSAYDQRSSDRVLAAESDAVDAYVQQKAKAGKVPSKRGAVRVARQAKKKKAIRRLPVIKSLVPAPPFADAIRAEVRERIDLVRDESLTLEQLAKRWKIRVESGSVRRYLREVALLGDVVKNEGERFTVTLSSERQSLEQFVTYMHAEIVRRRKEARDGYHAWRPDNVHTLNQSTLMDWIEEQFRLATCRQ